MTIPMQYILLGPVCNMLMKEESLIAAICAPPVPLLPLRPMLQLRLCGT